MCLVEDGLIGLNRPFVDYVPELDVPGVEGLAEARVADLLCHTSGIDDLALDAFREAAAERAPDLPPPAPGQHPSLNRAIRLAAGASSGSVRPPLRSAMMSLSSRSPNPVSDKSKPPSFNSPAAAPGPIRSR